MLGTCAVNEFSLEVCYDLSVIVHSHALSVSNIRDMGNFDVLAVAIFHELSLVLSLDNDRHSLLRLTDGKFSSIEPIVFYRNPVEINVKTVGKLTDCDAHAAGTEVIGLLYKLGHFRTAEQSLEFSLLRSISLLDLTAACLKRLLSVFL